MLAREEADVTYSQDGWIIWHLRGCGWRFIASALFDSQIFDITAAENNVFVESIGRPYGFVALLATFCAVRCDVFECYRGGFGIDLDESAHVAERLSVMDRVK